ncbi:YncE family protein [Argonema galeatum]|uniref:YncE family protein n=1 Tax=Argonema galeatum TaxID=2942762 RepID=UPI00201310D8|nr:YncE family protein [Argonema galeatum]MCL1463441.1 YncE family protein [Argonema galeatum A003/A1]
MPLSVSTIVIQQITEQETVFSQAQQGDPQAIATLINEVIWKKGITATVSREGDSLQLTLISQQAYSQEGCVKFVYEGLSRLGTTPIKTVRVIGQRLHSQVPAWSRTIELQPAKSTPVATPSPISQIVDQPKPQQKEPKKRHAMLWFSVIVLALVATVAGIATKELLENRTLTPAKKSAPLKHPASKGTGKTAPKPRTTPKNTPAKSAQPKVPTRMKLEKTIAGKISPKSVVHSGQGLFFAQNMMYSHTITVYNREHKLVKTIPDNVDLAKYGYLKFKGNYRGAPVEASFSHNGKYAWVSNYQMYGRGFNNPGTDRCSPSPKLDESFLYRINTKSLQVEKVIQVGAVPKFVATTPDNRLVLVSNWCSWDLSVVDTNKNKEIKRIKLGAYPRGIVVDKTSQKAYVAIMGSSDIAQVDLKKYSVKWLKNVGRAPRHLNIDPAGKFIYATLNNEGKIAKIALPKGNVVAKVSTGSAPRSMVISDDGDRLYVVNYNSNTVSKVRTRDLKVVQTVNVGSNPIGITYDPKAREVWVACYSGQIMVFQD